MKKLTKSLDEYVDMATENINQDRAVASKLLMELMERLAESSDKYKHKEFGDVASRYLETLQRSNEQLVKLASIIQKREAPTDNISEKERDDLFEQIKDNK